MDVEGLTQKEAADKKIKFATLRKLDNEIISLSSEFGLGKPWSGTKKRRFYLLQNKQRKAQEELDSLGWLEEYNSIGKG